MQAIEEDIRILENLLCELDVDTAIKILNLLEDHPQILEDAMNTDSEESSTIASQRDSLRSAGSHIEVIEERIVGDEGQDVVVLAKKASSASLKHLLNVALERGRTPPAKRPTSTKSVTFSIHTRTSSISSTDLVLLLKKSESVQRIVSRAASRASSSKSRTRIATSMPELRKKPNERHSTCIGLTKDETVIKAIKESLITVPKSRPITTENAGSTASTVTARSEEKVEKKPEKPIEKVEKASRLPKPKYPLKSQGSRKSLNGSKTDVTRRSVASKKSSSKQNSSSSLISDSRSSETKTASNATQMDVYASTAVNSRCFECKKKLGITSVFKCRCGNSFCTTHRYTDRHKCAYDYKEAGRTTLLRENPQVKKEKVPKI